ncbi:alcohol dehydrogenase [Halobacillus halophilus]|uniref:Alcohol dehydrogenase n=1 Tax=Halobacillus halophilus (strain ATCC 35676 / DSM 2266 / JCM 20832 / KCTC 3685 / LMG 17431 / NBRC 102448 / NCIMB 2269) TaxID=866895 RepID=I0JLT4_HALH3|nr:zinc-binding dehydrogenase [Halobacillus halophilus]ASF39204.1 alcohol dehydrogenase [Halobacillus halophilus]CCG45104.1 alcohol dehydrogenase [Halobacillus halophilus DSM 2266]
MKAVQVTGYGDVDQLEVVEKDIPEPKSNEVLIKVKACAINNTEIWMREGAYGTGGKSGWRPEGVQFPRIPGSDITGTIEKAGSEVDQHMIGRDVVVFPFTSSGDEGKEHIAEDMSFIGSEYDGGYAEYVVWPAELCFDMPLSDYTDSAVFSVSGMTAWHMIEQLQVQPGETIMVTGANGGVGSLNVQIASQVFGAKVIAIVGDLALEERLKELGADHVLSYRSERLSEEILEANGGPIDSVVDVVGDALFSTSLEVLKKGGKFCTSGSAGGQKTELDFRTLYLKHITLYGSVLGTRAEFKRMLQAISEGKIKPVIDRTFPLEEAREAQTYFKQAGKTGKIVLIP